MTRGQNKRGRSGFLRSDSAILIAVCAFVGLILLGLLLPALSRSNPKRILPNCANNLRQIGTAFQMWADDHNGRFPTSVPETNGGVLEAAIRGDIVRVFQSMSNELSMPKILKCPEDERVAATNFHYMRPENISYFVTMDLDMNLMRMFVMGDRKLVIDGTQVSNRLVTLSSSNKITWARGIHRNAGNILFGDWSVGKLSDADLKKYRGQTGTNINRLIFP